VPQKTELGDRICLIPGISCTVVVRPEPHPYYSIIGGSFVVDIMDGKALDFPDFEIGTTMII
jgi:hypothetical protein